MGQQIHSLLLKSGFSTVLLLLLATTIHAQQITVTGTVTSAETGETLPGVNVAVVGQSLGTVTNPDGNYEIEADADATLRFSYIGFVTQNIPVNGRDVIDLELAESVQDLDELVVLGYTVVSKRAVSSSVAQINERDIESITTTDPTEALEGKMAGVVVQQSSGRPGQNSSIIIRGMGSISASSSPLYVIDGVIAGAGDRDAVAPSDIESISVLKDAAATALYGSRASNGVVVITTKKGRAGDTRLNLRSSRGYSTTLEGNETWLDAQQLYDFHQNMQNAENGPFYNRPEVANINTNWRDVGFNRGITQMYDASISGGDDQTTFFVSGNFFQEEGTNIGTNFERISGRVNIQHNFSEDFTVAARVAGNYGTRDNVVTGNPYDILTFSRRALPWDSPYNADGTVRVGTESDWYSRDSENPLHGMQWNTDLDKVSFYSADIRLAYNITNWASFTSSNRYSQRDGRREIFLDSRSLAGGSRNGSIENQSNRSTSVLTSNLLNLNKGWELQSLSGLVGFEYQDNRADFSNFVGGGLAPGLKIADAAAVPYEVGGSIGESAFISYFAQAEYEYMEKYITTVSFRRDGSSRFGADNRFGNFYSVGASWVLSRENFLADIDAIDQLALRASYGTTGNASISNYEAQGLYSFTSNYIGTPASFPSRVPNANLTWEVAKTYNLGLDVALWNKVNVTVDVYQRTNEDLLQKVTLPGTSGIDNRILNVGSVENKGIELAINTTNIQSTDFSWTTSFTLSANRNRVKELFDGEPIDNGDFRIEEGYDINTFYLRHWNGVNSQTGAPQWINADGTITEDYGNAAPQLAAATTPDFRGGLSNRIQFKNFGLDAFFTYVSGSKGYYDNGIDFGAYLTTNYRKLRPGESYWQQPGDVSHYPANVVGGNNSGHLESTLFIYDQSYIRLRSARLSYTLPQDASIMNAVGLRNALIYVNGENLLTFTDWPGRDPAANDSSYPLARTFLFGIEIGF
ncbi:TonB-dependent receptor [soil metagenome]